VVLHTNLLERAHHQKSHVFGSLKNLAFQSRRTGPVRVLVGLTLPKHPQFALQRHRDPPSGRLLCVHRLNFCPRLRLVLALLEKGPSVGWRYRLQGFENAFTFSPSAIFPRRKKPSLRSNASISSAAKLPLYGNRSPIWPLRVLAHAPYSQMLGSS